MLAVYFIFFSQKFEKFNDKGALMLNSIYYMTLILLSNCIFGIKFQDFAIFSATLRWMSMCSIT